MWLPNLFSLEAVKEVQRRLEFWQGRLRKSRKDMWSCQRSVLVGQLLKGNEERKGRRWTMLIFLSYLIMQQKCSTNFFKGNQIIRSFLLNWKTCWTVLWEIRYGAKSRHVKLKLVKLILLFWTKFLTLKFNKWQLQNTGHKGRSLHALIKKLR